MAKSNLAKSLTERQIVLFEKGLLKYFSETKFSLASNGHKVVHLLQSGEQHLYNSGAVFPKNDTVLLQIISTGENI